jgi:hypothetical protein
MTAKCDDRCSVTIGEIESSNDYVPRGMGIGASDYVEFSWCLDCGQIQGKFPRPKTALEDAGKGEYEDSLEED